MENDSKDKEISYFFFQFTPKQQLSSDVWDETKIVIGKQEKWYRIRAKQQLNSDAVGSIAYIWRAGNRQGIYGKAKIVQGVKYSEDKDSFYVVLEYLEKYNPPLLREDLLKTDLRSIITGFQGTTMKIFKANSMTIEKIVIESKKINRKK